MYIYIYIHLNYKSRTHNAVQWDIYHDHINIHQLLPKFLNHRADIAPTFVSLRKGDVPSWLWQRCMGNMCGMPSCWDVNPTPKTSGWNERKKTTRHEKEKPLETTNFWVPSEFFGHVLLKFGMRNVGWCILTASVSFPRKSGRRSGFAGELAGCSQASGTSSRSATRSAIDWVNLIS